MNRLTFWGTMSRHLSKRYLDEFGKYVVMDPYSFVVDLKRSQGVWLATVDGDRIFDLAGYYGSKLIGHNHPRMREPDYLEQLTYAANNKVANPDFLTPECVAYYRLLYSLAPRCMRNDRLELYAINSGAEAVENMLKYFINLYDQKRATRGLPIGRRRFIYFDQAFHGRTVFALNITRLQHAPVITKDFQGLIENIEVPFPALDFSKSDQENLDKLENSLALTEEALKKGGDEIVGIIVEPIQGAGGHRVAAKEFFQKLSKLAHDYDVFLGFDEVQTAGGQTGEVFAVDLLNLPYPPQGVAAGKKLACGVVYMLHPMEDLGVLDSTWGGSLADMVRFCQEWKIVQEENLLGTVSPLSLMLKSGLMQLADKYPELLFNVRGLGTYQGFSLRSPDMRNTLIDLALEEKNTLLLGAGTDSVRLRPSLDITDKDIRLLLEILDSLLEKMSRKIL